MIFGKQNSGRATTGRHGVATTGGQGMLGGWTWHGFGAQRLQSPPPASISADSSESVWIIVLIMRKNVRLDFFRLCALVQLICLIYSYATEVMPGSAAYKQIGDSDSCDCSFKLPLAIALDLLQLAPDQQLKSMLEFRVFIARIQSPLTPA